MILWQDPEEAQEVEASVEEAQEAVASAVEAVAAAEGASDLDARTTVDFIITIIIIEADF